MLGDILVQGVRVDDDLCDVSVEFTLCNDARWYIDSVVPVGSDKDVKDTIGECELMRIDDKIWEAIYDE